MPTDSTPGRTCRVCGKPLLRRQVTYCDRACMIAGYRLPEPDYAALKHQAQRAVPLADACETCGATENLQRHHRDQNPANNDIRNIVTLCGSCHLKLHWRELGKRGKPRLTHCQRGHEMTEENRMKNGRCRACNRERQARYRARSKMRAVEAAEELLVQVG